MYPGSSYVNHSCLPNAVGIFDGRKLVFEALRSIKAGEEILQCYVRIRDGCEVSLMDWGFDCDCPRCSKTASPEEIAAFDAEFICSGCACVTTSRLRQAAEDQRGRCQCHARNFQSSYDASFTK